MVLSKNRSDTNGYKTCVDFRFQQPVIEIISFEKKMVSVAGNFHLIARLKFAIQ